MISISSSIKRSRKYVAGLTALAVLAMVVGTADAGESERSGRYKTQRGTEGTWWQRAKREPGNASRETRWKNRRGEGRARVERSWDKDKRESETQRTLDSADGRTATWRSRASRDADGAITREGSGTDLRGRDVSRTSRGQRDESGAWRRDTEVKWGSGRSATRQSTSRRTESGVASEGTYERSDGRSGTYQSSSSRSEGAMERRTSVTNQDGKTYHRDVVLQRDGDTMKRTVTLTGPDGESNSRTSELAVDRN